MYYILLDMDEVLVDFRSGACKLHGIDRKELEAKTEPGLWDMVEPMGITTNKFWKPIHEAGEEFWLGLDPLPWALDLLDLVKIWADKGVGIATTPSYHPSSYSGKVRWIAKHLGSDYLCNFFPTHRKSRLARKDTILIDDKESNCSEFKKEGGKAILFPSFGNYLHEQRDNPLQRVQYVLETQFFSV